MHMGFFKAYSLALTSLWKDNAQKRQDSAMMPYNPIPSNITQHLQFKNSIGYTQKKPNKTPFQPEA